MTHSAENDAPDRIVGTIDDFHELIKQAWLEGFHYAALHRPWLTKGDR